MVSQFASGAAVAKFPAGGVLVSYDLNDQSEDIVNSNPGNSVDVAVLGFYSVPTVPSLSEGPDTTTMTTDPKSGRLAVFGDSSCLDAAARMDRRNCFWLLKDILLFVIIGSFFCTFCCFPE
jgi:hypothetical protein